MTSTTRMLLVQESQNQQDVSLRCGAPKGQRPVIGVLDSVEVVMTAALVGVVAFRQEKERPLCDLRVFFGGVAAQPLKALPVESLFGLLLAIPALSFNPSEDLHVLCDRADACSGCLDAAANHLPA